MRYHSKLLGLVCGLFSLNSFSQPVTMNPASVNQIQNNHNKTLVDKRISKEEAAEPNPYAITLYKQNYLLPFYYTGSPDNAVYQNSNAINQNIKSSEMKYQISLKVPLWKDILSSQNSLYFAYTQQSYWQAYSKNAFFRETDYEPELFLMHEINIPLVKNWAINSINLGAVHQSNGFGNELERSWNRVYLELLLSNVNWFASVKPWYVMKDSTYEKYNPTLRNYLGYGEITVAYKINKHVLSLQMHSLIEQGGRYATGTFSYSFPLFSHVNGFLQIFSGYGQSLIEYNHHTNSIGIGLAINNII